MLAIMKLAEYLIESGVTQAEFAGRVGVTQGRVSQWLSGETITAERCVAIEAATNGHVTRFDLRPDLFGPASHQPASVAGAPVKKVA
jgi:DNA-binding transcriptional regulator YdaS (Cro superfamily)